MSGMAQVNTTNANWFYNNHFSIPVFVEELEIYGVRAGRVFKIVPHQKNTGLTVHGTFDEVDLGPVEDYEYGMEHEDD